MRIYKITSMVTIIVCVGFGLVQAEEKPLVDEWSLKGDLRLRGEVIDKEGEDTRNRARVRARIGLDAKVNDDIDVHVRIASGSDDPTPQAIKP